MASLPTTFSMPLIAARRSEETINRRGPQGQLERQARSADTLDLSLDLEYYNRYPLKALDEASRARTREIFNLAATSDAPTCDAASTEFGRFLDIHRETGWSAQYSPFKGMLIQIHAVHMAAAAGKIAVLEAFASERFFGQDNILNRQCILIKTSPASPPSLHYTPLMSALFMGNVEATIWLLDNGADVTVVNVDGLTPCHLLAQFGLTQEGADDRIKNLSRIIEKLVQKGADMSQTSGAFPDRTDRQANLLRSKTPLEIAKENEFPFPKQALHLLTKSYHSPADGQLFKEVHTIAQANPNAAEQLLQQMRKLDVTKVRRQLAREVSGMGGNHIKLFVDVFRKSPAAGVKLLDLLMMEPRVGDPQRYPLPLFSVLPNDSMLCTYERATTTAETPTWGKAPLLKCKNDECPEYTWTETTADVACHICRQTLSSASGVTSMMFCSHCGQASCSLCTEQAVGSWHGGVQGGSSSSLMFGPSRRRCCPSPECRRMVDRKRPRATCTKCLRCKNGTVITCTRKCGYSLCERCEREEVKGILKGAKDWLAPAWHSSFKKELPEDPLAHRHVHEVLVRVLHLPGVINLDILGILSMVPHDSRHKGVFAEVSVRAIITCVWALYYPVFLFTILRSLILLLVLLLMGLIPHAWQLPRVRLLLKAVMLEACITSCLNILSAFLPHGRRGASIYGQQSMLRERCVSGQATRRSSMINLRLRYRATRCLNRVFSSCRMPELAASLARRLHRSVVQRAASLQANPALPYGNFQNMPRAPKSSGVLPTGARIVWLCGLRELMNIFAVGVLFIGLHVIELEGAESPLRKGVAKVLVTSNILWQCFSSLAMLRTVQIVGPLILAVVHSFVPMLSMFLLMAAVFATFSFVFIILRDADRSVPFVLTYLFQALVLADRDTAETISGLDMAREQTLDFGQELFTGDGDPWLLVFSAIVAIAASSLFSLVLLNLTIGMYTKFYEKIEEEGDNLLLQMQAKRVFTVMLDLAFRIARWEKLPAREWLIVMNVGFFVALVAAILMEMHWSICSVLLTCMSLTCEVLLLYRNADIEDREHYLWVSYRADYAQPKASRDDLRQELEAMSKKHAEELAELRRGLAAISGVGPVAPAPVRSPRAGGGPLTTSRGGVLVAAADWPTGPRGLSAERR